MVERACADDGLSSKISGLSGFLVSLDYSQYHRYYHLSSWSSLAPRRARSGGQPRRTWGQAHEVDPGVGPTTVKEKTHGPCWFFCVCPGCEFYQKKTTPGGGPFNELAQTKKAQELPFPLPSSSSSSSFSSSSFSSSSSSSSFFQ